MDHMIPLTGLELKPFTPSFWRGENDVAEDGAPVFYLRVPTFAMRDKMAAILMQRGVIPVTQAQSRTILIDGLYEIYPEAEADDAAAFLEEYWTKAQVHEELVGLWQMREAQRIFDIGMGVQPTLERPLEQEALPTSPYTMRQQARQGRIVMDVIERCDRYRAYQARFMVADEEESAMLNRLFIAKWENCGDVVMERDELDRLTEACVERVRGWMAEEGSSTAWKEITDAVKDLFATPRVLEKNSASPRDTNSSQSGSPSSSGDLANSDGNSTTSSTTPAPSGKSPRKSGSSRNSRSGSTGNRKPRSPKPGRTGAPS